MKSIDWQPTRLAHVANEKAWDGEMKRLGRDLPWPFEGPDPVARCQVVYDNISQAPVILIAINEQWCDSDPVALAGIMAHEASHATDCLFDYMRAEPCGEIRAYMLEAVIKFLMTAHGELAGAT